MKKGYVDLSFELLDQLLKFKGAKIIGCKIPEDGTLRLFLVLDEPVDRFDNSWKTVNIDDLIEGA